MGRPLGAQVVPVVQLGRAQDPAQRAHGEADVGVDEHGPEAAEHHQRAHGLEGQPEDDARQVEAGLGADAVERVLPVGGQPVEVLGAVMDRVEAPQDFVAVASPVEPVDEHVAEYEGDGRLDQEGTGANRGADLLDGVGVGPLRDGGEHGRGEPGEDEVLPEEEAEVHAPRRPEHPLARTRREQPLERHEDDHEYAEGRGERDGAGHQRSSPPAGWGSTMGPPRSLVLGK
jgi:hypothetical protein